MWLLEILTVWTFDGKATSLIFNMLFKFVTAFFSRSKLLFISWLRSLSKVILEPKKIKSVTSSTFPPSIWHKWWIWIHDPSSLNGEFEGSFFTLIKRLFSSSSISATRVVSSAYLRLLIFLLAILITACNSSSPAFHMMYSAYKWNKQGDNIQPCHTPFPVLNQSIVPCPVQTVLLDPYTGFSGDR